MALDGSRTTTLVLGRNDADIDGLLRIGRERRIVGATSATERREFDYFDPELKRLSASLARAFGGGKHVSIVDATADEGKLVVYAAATPTPGVLPVLKSTSLPQCSPARPTCRGAAGRMRPVHYPERRHYGSAYRRSLQGTARPPDDGWPHGGPQSRDEWVSTGSAVLAAPGYACCSRTFAVGRLALNGFATAAGAVGKRPSATSMPPGDGCSTRA